MTILIVTLVGKDQPGFVRKISELVLEHQGNWGSSRMSEMSGRFAGIVEIEVARERSDALIEGFKALDTSGMAHVQIERADEDADEDTGGRHLALDVVSQDHPGIVHDISRTLQDLNVSIQDMDSERLAAPNGNGFLFNAMLALSMPDGLDDDDVISALQALSDDLMIDIIEDDD
ncbi:hypothetical protein OAS86_03620 [Gammaproteobacteria bacterium]|nr:hypothetical protein [Gammaproteobacteria bacterium]